MTQGCGEPGIAPVPGGHSVPSHFFPLGNSHELLRAVRALEHCLGGLKNAQIFIEFLLCICQRV